MKVVCIDNSSFEDVLMLNKEYTVIDKGIISYLIACDDKKHRGLSKDRFRITGK